MPKLLLIEVFQAQIWDTLGHLLDDYRLVRRNRLCLAMVVYFISRYLHFFFRKYYEAKSESKRVATLAYMIGYTVLNSMSNIYELLLVPLITFNC